MPELIPVDHDPFESGAGPSFSPVEHDPFAAAPEKTFAGLPKGGGVESEGMSDVIGAVKQGAKAFLKRYFEPSEAEKTGNVPIDILKGGAEAAMTRPFSAAQAGAKAGIEAFGPKVDPLMAQTGMRPMQTLGRDIPMLMESEMGRAGATAEFGAGTRPHGTMAELNRIAQEAKDRVAAEAAKTPTARVLDRATAEQAPGAPPIEEPLTPYEQRVQTTARPSVGAAGGAICGDCNLCRASNAQILPPLSAGGMPLTRDGRLATSMRPSVKASTFRNGKPT